MDGEDAPAPLHQDLVVAPCLGELDLAEGQAFAGNRDVVGRRIGGDLEEQAAVRAALVGLAGRVEEAGPEAENGGAARRTGDAPAQGLEQLAVPAVALEVSRDDGVPALRKRREVRAQELGQTERAEVAQPDHALRHPQIRTAVARGRRSGNLAACGFHPVHVAPRDGLGRLHVRLVERVHAQQRAGHGSGELPAEELAAQVGRQVRIDAGPQPDCGCAGRGAGVCGIRRWRSPDAASNRRIRQ